jgi:hypothetical protein
MLVGVAEAAQGEDRVDDRGEDRAQAVESSSRSSVHGFALRSA